MLFRSSLSLSLYRTCDFYQALVRCHAAASIIVHRYSLQGPNPARQRENTRKYHQSNASAKRSLTCICSVSLLCLSSFSRGLLLLSLSFALSCARPLSLVFLLLLRVWRLSLPCSPRHPCRRCCHALCALRLLLLVGSAFDQCNNEEYVVRREGESSIIALVA